MKSFHFETSQHKAMECETFTKNMHDKNQDGICHVTRNKNEDECMQTLKQKEDLGSTKRLRCPKPLFLMEQKLS
jgi:hypothetical protein